MTAEGRPRTFETSLEIAAPRDLVWKAISEAVELQRWFAPRARVEPGAGGTIEWEWPGLHAWPQTIEVWEPGRRLVTRYDSPVDDGAGGRVPLFIEWSLSGEGGRTTLRLVQSGFGRGAEFDAEYDGISRGWPVELRSLRLYLEHHAGRERRLVSSLRFLDVDPDEAWRRLTGPEGLGCGPGIQDLREGDPFAFAGFEGKALACFPREFSGHVTSHGDAWLRVVVERCGGPSFAWLTLALYGEPPVEAAADVQKRFDAMMDRLFAETAKA